VETGCAAGRGRPYSSGECADLRTEEGGCWMELDSCEFRGTFIEFGDIELMDSSGLMGITVEWLDTKRLGAGC
jgi:hypothetical protein